MSRALTIAGLVVAVLILLVFGLDLAIGMPFGKISLVMDLTFVGAAGALGYLSWMTLRQQT